MDWVLFTRANSLAGRSPLLDTAIRVLMNDYLLPTALILVLFALWFAGPTAKARQCNQQAVLSAIAAMLLGNLLVKGMNVLFYRHRPFADHDVTLLFYRPSDSSFPSNAATVGFSIATAVWLFNRKAGLALYLLAAALGMARVCGGVHYPSDIVGGLLVGLVSAQVVVKRLRFLNTAWTLVLQRLRAWLLA